MFIELVDSLRCLTPHEDTPLVAVSRRMEGRSIVEGTLGCPVCRRQYAIADGVAWFGVEAGTRADTPSPTLAPAGDDGALRLAAFLGVESPGGIVVLDGSWSRLAMALREIVPLSCVLVDPPPGVELVGEGIGAIRSGGVIPLAQASVRGVALDAGADTTRVTAALRVLSSRARLVAPSTLAVPDEVDELARDERLWVGRTRVASSAPVSIARGARSSG
jgi:uncharacterized protein YbaR (Trm112 family)